MVAAEMRATPRSDCRPSITARIASGAASIACSMARSKPLDALERVVDLADVVEERRLERGRFQL